MRLGSFSKFWAASGDEARKYAQFIIERGMKVGYINYYMYINLYTSTLE